MYRRRRSTTALLTMTVAVVGVVAASSSVADAARTTWGIGSALTPLHRPAAAPASPKTSSHTAPATGGFSLVRTYTFTASALDPDWAVYDNSHTSNPDSRVRSLVSVSDGALHVATSGAQGSGLCLCRGAGKPGTPYGRWEIRARAGVSADHGFAMLLWPNAENWPTGGEIDIAEFPGATRSVLQTSLHYSSANRQVTAFTPGSYSDWHTYVVTWTRTSIAYAVDGRTVMTVTNPALIPTGAMHLALQAGMNSGVTSATATPARTSLDVAWVKLYR